ncbi:sterol desaturase family protein [Inhella sp.]|uniref:sterol desaturase family protein n=1 Tax=Inhella sp. TaxID=1921806 RepID=UPI0035B4AD57
MNPLLQNTLIVCLILGYAGMEFATRRYQDTVRASRNDTWLEGLMFVSLLAVAQPTALLGSNALCTWLLPEQRNALADWPWWAMVGVLLVADDMTQYWWHRLSHTPLLWPLHRAHHSARYMSIRITYRNNFFYYLLMPGLWLSGVLLYLGFGAVYLVYVVVKIGVILGAHCAWRWDEVLYRHAALRPLAWIVERTISTPATHWAHHAMSDRDGVGHYKGNFGNLLFVWDLIFGSAHITRRYPPEVGLVDDKLFGDEHWTAQMFYPLVRSQRKHTALRPGGKPYVEAEREPA